MHSNKTGRKKDEKTKRFQIQIPESMHGELSKIIRKWAKKKIKQQKLKSQK